MAKKDDDEKLAKAEGTAEMILTIYLLSQKLNLPIEDAASIFIKVGEAFTKLGGRKIM